MLSGNSGGSCTIRNSVAAMVAHSNGSTPESIWKAVTAKA